MKFKFNYIPALGSIPIHEVTTCASSTSTRIFGLTMHENLLVFETFRSVVGNPSGAFVRKERAQTPMDFGIITG